MNPMTRVLSGVAAAGLMAAAMWLHELKPHTEDRMLDPITTHGRIGAVVANRVFSIRVERVDVASAIVRHDIIPDKVLTGPGIFVIVQLSVRSNQKPFTPGHVRLVARGGLSYDESGRIDIIDRNVVAEPLMWIRASYVFEIPKDRLAGSRLVVGESGLMDQLSAETDVDLGIDSRKAAEMVAHAPRDYVLKTA